MEVKKDILWRIYLTFFILVLGGVAILFQSFRIQTVEGKELRAAAEEYSTKYMTIEAERGNVYSEDGKLLATSLPLFEMRMDLKADGLTDEVFSEKVDSLALMLSLQFKDRTKTSYKQKLISARAEGNRYFLLARKVTYPEMQEMKSWPILRLGKYKGGLIVLQKNVRKNPYGILAHRTIGYVRENSQSIGLEAWFNSYLRGVDGKRLMQRIAGGNWVPINDENEIETENGMDLITTLDVGIQDITETALHRGLVKHNAHHGCAIVMEVATGKIKAIANLKRMEDNTYWEGYNYAIGESTEPGSTMKLASVLALFDDGHVSPDDSVDIENGRAKFFDRIMKDSEPHAYRNVSVRKAFEISSNVGMAKLVWEHYKKKPEKFISKLEDFGITSATGITLKGETYPYLQRPGTRSWSGTSLPWMSTGYAIELTPLQTLQFYNAVANGGRLMKPYLVNSINEYGNPVKSFEPKVVTKHIASEEAIALVQELLAGVVIRGTATNIKSSTCSFAGKTGTAIISDENRGYGHVYQASFAGYFPADAPKYSVIVVVNNPSNGFIYGSSVAAPVFKEIAEKVYSNSVNTHVADSADLNTYLKNISVPVTKREDLEVIARSLGLDLQYDKDTDWLMGTETDTRMQSIEIEGNKMPGLNGMGLKDAMYIAENLGLKVVVHGRGKVKKQSIPKGKAIRPGDTVYLTLSTR